MNFFITNREILKKGNKESIREDGCENASDNLRFGTYDIAKNTFNLFPEPEKETDLIYSIAGNVETSTLKGSSRFFKEVWDELIKEKNSGDVLFFIHGFNTDLDGVRDAFKRLNKKYVKEGSPIKHIMIFTWPGRSPVIPYHYFDDKKDAIRSGEALARGVEKLLKFFNDFFLKGRNPLCTRKIHLMVHSMGNRVLKHTILELTKLQKPIPELFKEIILVAADIEYNIFEPHEAFDTLINLGDRVHIYFHEKDRVLDISAFTKNLSNRLGKHGRKEINPAQKYVIDADVTKTNDDKEYGLEESLLNHWYYYTSTEAVNDIIAVLNGKLSKYKV